MVNAWPHEHGRRDYFAPGSKDLLFLRCSRKLILTTTVIAPATTTSTTPTTVLP